MRLCGRGVNKIERSKASTRWEVKDDHLEARRLEGEEWQPPRKLPRPPVNHAQHDRWSLEETKMPAHN